MAAPSLRTWTREEYDRLADLGVFKADERLELVDGQIVRKMTHNPPHFQAFTRVSTWLGGIVGQGLYVRSMGPIALSDISEPEPDVVVAIGTDETYSDRHPEPSEVVLLVEISHSSIDRDRRIKLPLYAAAGIPEAWLLDIDSRKLEIYRDPFEGRFKSVTILAESETAATHFAPEASIRVSALLPSRK